MGKSVLSEPLTVDISMSASSSPGALTLTLPLTDENFMLADPSIRLNSTLTFPLTVEALT